MNTRLAIVAAGLIAAVPVAAIAQADHSQHMSPAKASAASSLTPGLVRKVDVAQGTVTIAHDEIRNLSMPKMTMTFKVRDAAWLKKLNEGDRIRFAAESVKGDLVVTAYEAIR